MLNGAVITDLREKLRGPLLTPDALGYDATRKVFNGMVNKRPALIARCTSPSDVMACVNFARDHEVLLSVRGGGHNFRRQGCLRRRIDAGLYPDEGHHGQPDSSDS